MAPRSSIAVAFIAILMLPAVALGQEAALSPSTPVAGDADPNSERPLTHHELLDVRGEISGWPTRPTTFVADVSIDRDQPIRGHVCRRGVRLCSYGRLPRDGAHPDDPVVSVRPADVERLGAGKGVLQGRFAFVRSVNSLRLVDPVAAPAGSYLTPIEPDSMATAAALPVGSLIVARGWLSVLRGEDTCPKVPKEPRALDGRRGGWDSPFVRCPGGWLAAAEVLEADPADPLRPTSYGIPVQFGALDRYGAVDEGPTTYLLRRVANPVPDTEPARGWRIAGRLAAVEGLPVPTTSIASNTVRPSGLDWHPVVERQPPADTRRIYSTDWAGGFASIHQGADHVLSTWVSADGMTWDSAALPAAIRTVAALLELKDGLALIANHRGSVPGRSFDVWRSGDGLEWRHAGRKRISTLGGLTNHRRVFHGFWSLGDRIVTMESYSLRPPSTDAIGVWPDDPSPDVTYAWTSTNGRRWQREIATGLGGRKHGIHSWFTAQGDGELLMLQENQRRDLRRSTDGVRWERIGSYPQELITNAPFAFTRVRDSYAIAGEPTDGTYGDGNFLTIWHGTGQGDWVRVVDRPSRMPTALVSTGSTVVLAGDRFDFTPRTDGADPWFVPFVMASTDGGRTWDESVGWTDDQRWCDPTLAAREGAVVLGWGCPPADGASKYVAAVAPADSDLRAAVPTPRQALSCDARGKIHSVRDEWRYLSGLATPTDALQEILDEGFVVPRSGYRELARGDDTVLFGFRNGRDVKVAVRVTATRSGGWIPEWLADCDLSEFGRGADMGPGVWLWANRDGRTIQERRGPAHCRQQSTRTLWLDRPRVRGRALYVRDPEGQFRDQWQAPYLRSTTLPADVRNTGYRRDGASIWMAADKDSVYIKQGGTVQRWPRIPGSALGCA